MRSSIKVLGIAATLSLITLNGSCSTSQRHSPPVLELRTLELDPEHPGVFYYPTETCTKKGWFGICTKREITNELFDTHDKATLARLVNMGFVLVVREKP